MNTEYRTSEQFQEITENMYSGNWTDAGKQCAEYGFYANDLQIAHERAIDEGTAVIDDVWDYCELLEIANKYR